METTLPGNLKRGKELQFLAGWRGCGPDLLPPAPGNFPVQPLQPPASSSQLTSHHGCYWFYLSIYFGRASELFEIPRYHRWRKIGVALLAARNTSPTTAIGSKTWNCIVIAECRCENLNFRDREEWFPGRRLTASRLKESGKHLAVELQQIVNWDRLSLTTSAEFLLQAGE